MFNVQETNYIVYVKHHELFNTVKTIKVKTSSNGYSIYVSHSGPKFKKSYIKGSHYCSSTLFCF